MRVTIDDKDIVILLGIATIPCKSVRELGRDLQITANAIQQRLNKLVQAGLITEPLIRGAARSRALTRKGEEYVRSLRESARV